jgi:hypothetical protein
LAARRRSARRIVLVLGRDWPFGRTRLALRARYGDGSSAVSVEPIPAAYVRDVAARIHAARQRAVAGYRPAPQLPDARYWEGLFEANATDVLAELPSVTLPEGFVVRYRFFGQRSSDLLVRPFVARSTTDVETIRQLIDWHPAPDSLATSPTLMPTQDVQLLYRHFSFPATALGYFDYWLAMQELWASGRWVHSHLLASAEELGSITAGGGWEVLRPVEAYQPSVIRTAAGARLAVLVQTSLRRFEISLQQIEIAADRSLRYHESILVASGPRGYLF